MDNIIGQREILFFKNLISYINKDFNFLLFISSQIKKSPITAKKCCYTQQRISDQDTQEYMKLLPQSQLNQIQLHDKMLEMAREYDEKLAQQYDEMNQLLKHTMLFEHQYVSLPVEFQSAQLQTYVEVCNNSLNEIIH